jgi:short-subunit dehydrogenase involved in D-alanine esterification of teichoic acids
VVLQRQKWTLKSRCDRSRGLNYCLRSPPIHSFAMSRRFILRDSSVAVKEIAPTWVGTGFVSDADDPHAVPVARFVSEVLRFTERAPEYGHTARLHGRSIFG